MGFSQRCSAAFIHATANGAPLPRAARQRADNDRASDHDHAENEHRQQQVNGGHRAASSGWRMSSKARSHRRSGLRSPVFASAMILFAIACLTSSSQSPVRRLSCRADSMGGKNSVNNRCRIAKRFRPKEIEVAPISLALLRIACLVILYKTSVFRTKNSQPMGYQDRMW